VTVQVPAFISVATLPLMEHTAGVEELKPTLKPELAVAMSVNATPATWVLIGANVMLCAAGVTGTTTNVYA
jgi:hypothetical protein